MSTATHQAVLERIRAEYLEMPGMKLTLAQAQRLCGIEWSVCQMVFDALVEANFLCCKLDGTYVRLTEGDIPRPRPAKADLRSNTFVAGSLRREAS